MPWCRWMGSSFPRWGCDLASLAEPLGVFSTRALAYVFGLNFLGWP